MRDRFKVESFEKSINDLRGLYAGDDLEGETRKMLTQDIWNFLDYNALSLEILDYTISYNVYTRQQGDIRYSAVVSLKYKGE